MAFRMRNAHGVIQTEIEDTKPRVELEAEKKEKVYTQEDIDLIDAKYAQRMEKIRQFVEDPANPLLESYRQSLLKEEINFEKDVIVFDKNTGKWKLVKVKDSSGNKQNKPVK